jgi:hypothetical protein
MQKKIESALRVLSLHFGSYHAESIKGAWQTLKTAVLAQQSHNKPSIPVCPHYSREMVKSSEYVEFDICTCQGNTGKPAHVG